MDLSARTPGVGFGLSFDEFVQTLGKLLWVVLSQERARRFHGGRPCPQRRAPGLSLLRQHDGKDTCPEDCAFFYFQTAVLLCDELRRAQAKGDPFAADPGTFVRISGRRRFRDVLRMVNQVERGHLTRVRRTVEAKWVGLALGGNEYHKRLLVDLLLYLQSDDPAEPGGDFPYGRMAADHGTGERIIARDVGEVIRRIEQANPAWADQHIYRLLGERLARHCVPTEILDVFRPGDEDARDHVMAYHLLEAAAQQVRSGAVPARALADVITERLGRRAAARAEGSPHWWGVVATLAGEPDEPEPGAA